MFDAIAAHMESEELKSALRAWDLARLTPTGAPRRSAFDPLNCPKALPFLWMYQDTPDGFKCLLAGESVSDGWQTRLKGRYLQDIMGPDSAIVARRFRYVLDTVSLAHGKRYTVSRNHLLAERFFVPLLDEDNAPRYVMGATHYRIQSIGAQNQDQPPTGVLPVPTISFYSVASGALILTERTQG